MDQEPISASEPTHPNPSPKKTAEEQDFWRFAAELLRTALIVVILAYVLRLFVFEPFVVEGTSMSPRFETNDFLIIDKITYHFESPQRGDIIVFKYPYDTSTNYIKRIIGLPGETVKIANNQVTIYNSSHQNGFILSEPYVSSGNVTAVSDLSKNEFTVPQGEYFVLGDNREASSDSRAWGYLPSTDIIGKVDIEAYPFSAASIVHSARYANE
jgi:signal peptidase I